MANRVVLKGIFLFLVLSIVFTAIVTAMKGGFASQATEVSQAPTFLEQFFISGGPIVWFVLLPISLLTVYLAVEYSLTIRRKRLLPAGIKDSIIHAIDEGGLSKLEENICDNRDLVSMAAVKAVRQSKDDWVRMRNTLTEFLQERAWALMRRIEWANLIGNVSPMVGLFGTVFGMIKLFNAIVTSGGQPQPAQLAQGISIALVTTFWGLCIAIPALAIYGIFRNRIETLASDAASEMEEIIPHIRRSVKKTEHEKDVILKSAQQNIISVKSKIPQKSTETFSVEP